MIWWQSYRYRCACIWYSWRDVEMWISLLDRWAAARRRVLPLGECGVCRARMTLKADRYGGGDVRTTSHVSTPTRAESRGPLTEDRSFHNPRKKKTASKNTGSAGTRTPSKAALGPTEATVPAPDECWPTSVWGRCLVVDGRKDARPRASRVSRCHSTGRTLWARGCTWGWQVTCEAGRCCDPSPAWPGNRDGGLTCP